jgi:hypothetical protein
MNTIPIKDKEILRELANQVAEIAALPVQQETKNLWKALNGLKPVRPMVMIDQIPWHEMDVEGELVLRTEDSFCRSIEEGLRRTLYHWRYMQADMVVESFVEIPKVIRVLTSESPPSNKQRLRTPKMMWLDIITSTSYRTRRICRKSKCLKWYWMRRLRPSYTRRHTRFSTASSKYGCKDVCRGLPPGIALPSGGVFKTCSTIWRIGRNSCTK